jgi:hypothetical protein
MQRKRKLSAVVTTLAVAALSLLFVGCPPQHYMRVTNKTGRTVKVDFASEGSGTFLPHFVLMPGESRRVSPPARQISAHDLEGHIIGAIDLEAIHNWSPYYSRTEPYTFNLLVSASGITLLRPQ